jgi:molybdopterin molybdotransferase
VLAEVRPLPAEQVDIIRALDRVLAVDVRAADDVPPWDNSAMDGFALRSADTRLGGSARARLELVGESRAGAPAERSLGRGEAIRISTGAVLPAGADAVVRIEDCREDAGVVETPANVPAGNDVRRRGDDVRAGDFVLSRGRRLEAAELGVLASVGMASAPCARRSRVAVVTTGDELAEPGEPLGPGQIRNTNRFAVAALSRLAGAEVVSVESVGDDRRATAKALERGLDADVLVSCGGVSVGEHDHVRPALEALGVQEVFWGVALRPGHPTWFGVAQRPTRPTLVFGLPGNPVSAMVTFHLFVRPALLALTGEASEPRRAVAVMDERYPKRPGRAHAVRCRLELQDDGWHVRPTKAQGSHVLTSMLDADALALLEVERGDVSPGERVTFELL